MPAIDDIIDNFSLLDEWDDRIAMSSNSAAA